MPGIGILSSIHYSNNMQTAFQSGLGMNPLPSIYPDVNQGFTTNRLNTALNNIAANNATLIVTFGGLIACNAAINHPVGNPNIPFISLVGDASVFAVGGNFRGCVSLESFALDSVRIAWLITQGFPANAIGLYYNPNSAMANRELAGWTGGQTVPAANASANPTQQNFTADLITFGPGIRAIVVSADPLFQDNKDFLIAAANATGNYMCYPFRDYTNKNGTQPNSGSAVIIGPDLTKNNSDGAYYMIGQMAAAIFNGVNANPGINKAVAQIILPL
jgi:hypothetical protein